MELPRTYDEIVSKFDGKEVSRFSGEKTILKLKREPSRIPDVIASTCPHRVLNPNIALVLGLIGLLGLYIEFTSPGVILPGVIGGVCLFLALVAFNLLPVNFLGIALLSYCYSPFYCRSEGGQLRSFRGPWYCFNDLRLTHFD
jgi:membrane-bound serine protease (ClpP class)